MPTSNPQAAADAKLSQVYLELSDRFNLREMARYLAAICALSEAADNLANVIREQAPELSGSVDDLVLAVLASSQRK